ncbi:MAG: histidine kinase [Flavobacteriales bacterium]|nr:histidine kinase [Flavobacteriales bacterium]
MHASISEVRMLVDSGQAIAVRQGDTGAYEALENMLCEAYVIHRDPTALTCLDGRLRKGGRSAALAKFHLVNWYLDAKEQGKADSLLLSIALAPAVQQDDELLLRGLVAHARIAADARNTGSADSLASVGLELGDSATGALQAQLLRMQGMAQLNAGRPEQARLHLLKALSLAETSGATHEMGACHLAIGWSHADAGSWDDAGEHLTNALKIFETTRAVRDIPIVLDALAFTLWGILDAHTVDGYWKRAFRLADSLGMTVEAARIRCNQARFVADADSVSCIALGIPFKERNDSSFALLRSVRELADSIGNRVLLAQTIKVESAILNRTGRAEEGVEASSRAYAIFKEEGDRAWMVTALIDIASSYIRDEHWQKALPVLHEALHQAEEGGFIRSKQFALNRLYFVYKNLGRTTEALNYLEQRDLIQDSLESTEVTAKLAQQEVLYSSAKMHLADSLAHAQQLAMEQESSRQQVQRQRTRTQAIAGGGALLLLGGGVAFALDRKRRRERFEKEAARLETQALRSQMNPHFIFNALNSISAYIRQQQPEKAHGFIARFGKLMRLVLENSRKTEVPLESDLEALRLYLELEQARTENKFDFTIDVDHDIDPAEVSVPPLVMQPFLENAIWHGMAGKEGRGLIVLHVSRNGDSLTMDISDDGVGRNAARPQPLKEEGKTSLGTLITRARLDLVQKQKGRPAGFQYIEQAIGTRVQLVLPI